MVSPGAEKPWAKLVKYVQNEPRRIIHSFKVGLALVLVSILHHFRPSFYGFGENIIWAVMTVVLVIELSVGATLGRGLNRMFATGLAAALGLGTHRLASLCGKNGKDVVISAFIFVIGAILTFMRLSPQLMAKYDYGFMIFILTFCLVTLSEFTDGELFQVVHERLLTIIIGSLIAIAVCVCIYPIWIGEDLHNQIAGNIIKVADFLEGFGDEYFKNSENTKADVVDKPFLGSYKQVLSSKSAEESKAVLARWEPCHGQFRFRHPWNQYLKTGNLTRLCAYKIEALSVYLLNSEQVRYSIFHL
ncbi:aluminum-activated malate transporter 2-like [Lotus japonicus]|uniref:aluminum-activated malate transporter 2-like n=1 Tax=Lotus japonicus TaxID=34305 RepID=UPI002583FBE0|nr:aluminum-activated malate transporter 2-like [Lotus japonicus]